jgi:hypothetical protein
MDGWVDRLLPASCRLCLKNKMDYLTVEVLIVERLGKVRRDLRKNLAWLSKWGLRHPDYILSRSCPIG